MVGGIVTGIARQQERTHVTVSECPHYPKHCIAERPDGRPVCHRPDTCSVYTDEIKIRDGEKVSVGIGDSFWWQGGRCMWTPKENRGKPNNKCGKDYDIELTKLGYSH